MVCRRLNRTKKKHICVIANEKIESSLAGYAHCDCDCLWALFWIRNFLFQFVFLFKFKSFRSLSFYFVWTINWQGLRAVHWWNCLLRRVQCISTSHKFYRQWFATNAVYHLQNHLRIVHRLDWSSLHAPARNDLWMILRREMKRKEELIKIWTFSFKTTSNKTYANCFYRFHCRWYNHICTF